MNSRLVERRASLRLGLRAQGMAFNSAGNLFVANGHIISEFTPDGAQSTFASGLPVAPLGFPCLGMAFDSEETCLWQMGT